ncbi:hypothetical protein E3N88_15302 [Mikania micrantha]|uniref:SWIM-type domain-containing protein n=1 Tax=Mikania micrantha TaxID=192012 RepID=A0A5N6NVN3_9ASTR|nr:hypothetical protein E3N88_15302 [Mikania micrantha]
MFSPIFIQLYWGGVVSYENGRISCDNNTRNTTLIIQQKISNEEFLNLICLHLKVDKDLYRLTLKLYYTFQGTYQSSEIFNDSSLEVLYYLAANVVNFNRNVHVIIEPRISLGQSSCMDLLRGFSSVNESPLGTMVPYQGFTDSHVFEAGPSTNTSYHHLSGNVDGSDSDSEAEPPTSEESEAVPSSVETTDVDADEPEIEPRFNSTNVSQPANIDLNYSNDPEELKVYATNDSDDDDDMEIWDENYPARVGLGMYFRNKNDVMLCVRSWNINCGKELYVVESKSAKWRAKCYTENPNCNTNFTSGLPCNWYVYAVKRRNDHMWQIIRWVDSHNCYDTIVGNENRSLKSKDVATRILHNMREDLACPVKQIRAFIKDQLNVDISYSKAWRARKEAIERIYGSWESNFEELPRYIAALHESNPGTIVEWFHAPTGSSKCYTFKYVFWAFGPAIKAILNCQPILSVDGTHLKGSYRGKMLIAVTKNANIYIVPIAYAVVDEETVESWTWFFNQLWVHIAAYRGKKLCVISDRYKEAWEYLKGIKESKWTLLKDKNHRQIAWNCYTRLPPCTWRWFEKRDVKSREHRIMEFDFRQGRYKVVSKIQTNSTGGNDYTVDYLDKKCTCGKWQMQRFPYSHAIAVCHNREDPPETIVHELYTTGAYKAQYDGQFFPLSHQDYWNDPGWRIKVDASKITTSRGRQRSRRIHNEMDVHHPDQPRVFRCGICKQVGHRRNACQSSHP